MTARRSLRLVRSLLVRAAVLVAALSLLTTVGTFVWAKVVHGGGELVMVTSNSMKPFLAAGDVIVASPVNPADLTVGDVVMFRQKDGSQVTHRIVKVESESGLSFRTKGDNNNGEDANPFPPASVRGEVTGHVPVVGEAVVWLTSWTGRAVTLGPAALVFVLAEIAALWRDPAKDDQESPVDTVHVSA